MTPPAGSDAPPDDDTPAADDGPASSPRPDNSPLEQIRRWLPHLLLMAILAAALWLIAHVIAPLRVPLLLAGATAMLTTSALFHPCLRLTAGLLPRLNDVSRRQVAAILATTLLVGIVASPLALIVLSVVHSLSEGWNLLMGIILQDQERLVPFFTGLQQQLAKLAVLYPGLDLDPAGIVTSLKETMQASQRLGPTFLAFLFKGSSRLAELILALICLSFFYAHGPRFLKALFTFSPLNDQQQARLVHRHNQVAEQILTRSLGSAVVKGVLFGLITWLAGLPVPAPLIALVAGILSLLPMVGLTMIWLPLGIMAWTAGRPLTAGLVVLACLLANYGFGWISHRYLRHRGIESEGWLNFALFIGLIGGVLAFGFPGLIIGPVAVAFGTVLTRHGLPLYQSNLDETRRFETAPQRPSHIP